MSDEVTVIDQFEMSEVSAMPGGSVDVGGRAVKYHVGKTRWSYDRKRALAHGVSAAIMYEFIELGTEELTGKDHGGWVNIDYESMTWDTGLTQSEVHAGVLRLHGAGLVELCTWYMPRPHWHARFTPKDEASVTDI
jgi:hypothetical protein